MRRTPGEIGFLQGENDNLLNEVERLTRIINSLSSKEQDHEQEIGGLKQEIKIVQLAFDIKHDQLTTEREAKLTHKNFALVYKGQRDVERGKVKKLRATLKGLPRWAYVEDEHWDSIQQTLADTEER